MTGGYSAVVSVLPLMSFTLAREGREKSAITLLRVCEVVASLPNREWQAQQKQALFGVSDGYLLQLHNTNELQKKGYLIIILLKIGFRVLSQDQGLA